MTTLLRFLVVAYTTGMNIFAKVTQPISPRSKDIQKLSFAFAAILIIMAVAQLFTFEKFAGVFAAMWLPGSDTAAPIYAAVITVLEVMALPFLLLMSISPLMRVASMVSGWLVVAFWFSVMLWQNLTINVIGNNGLLGATVHLPVGWWSVLACIALGALAGWVSWGSWPLRENTSK